MADMLEQGSKFLDRQRHAHMTRPVVYWRGGLSREIQATIGRTEFEQADDAGLIHRIESQDFIVQTGDLDLGEGLTLPKAGDSVRETADSRVFVYEVNAPGGQTPWRYSDPYRTAIRVHTKHIATEAA